MRLFFISLLSLCLFQVSPAHAMNTTPHVTFDVKKANQQFDQINIALSVEDLNLNNLENAIATLDVLNHQAENCIVNTQQKIDELNDLSLQNGNIATTEKNSVDAIYINAQKKGLSAKQAECRLFSIRAQEAINAYRTATAKIVKKVTFTRGASLWTAFEQLKQSPLTVPADAWTDNDFKLNLGLLGIGYVCAMFATLYLFKRRRFKAYFLLHTLDYHFFKQLAVTTLTLYAIAQAGTLILTQLKPIDATIQLGQSIYLLTVICIAIGFIHYFFSIHRNHIFIKQYRRFVFYLTICWFGGCAILDVMGYHLLAMNLTFSSFLTCAIVLLTVIFTITIHQLYLLGYTQPKFKHWITYYIGYKPEHVFIEFLILKTVVQIVIIASGIYLVGETLDFASYYVESFYSEMLSGIHVASIMIYPGRMLTGIVIYCLLFLICRIASTSIIRHHQFDNEEETQVALASILTYAGFSFALITGLVVAGFNFTGLAIIAGALSVGIGLGLQSIVNNFVSGLILLIEKPIRPSDRISVDGAEGFVKKIRVRSTHIITPSREDIIIPNSDLITRRVTNYMYSDKNCRISCDIEVAYGSDTHAVRDALLSVANLHEDVVKTGRYKPFVLFRSFGDNNLHFQLWCLIKDVNKKLVVQSDLHYAIEEVFRKQHITMAFPQREVHINFTESQHTKN